MDVLEGLRRLTLSERAVLRLLSESMSTRQIADRLALSEKTVENRRCAIAQKLGLGGGRGLARFAVEFRPAVPEVPARDPPPAPTSGAAAP